MNSPLDDLPFDIHTLIPYEQFNWDCVEGLDCVYKDIQAVYSSITSHLGKGIDSVQYIVDGIMGVLLDHYSGSTETATSMLTVIQSDLEKHIKLGLSGVTSAPSVSAAYRQPYIVYREDECKRFLPMVELWPNTPTEVEFYGPYKNQAILRMVASDSLPEKNIEDIVLGGDSVTASLIANRYNTHPSIEISGTIYSPSDFLAEDNLNKQWNDLYKTTLLPCRIIPDETGLVPPNDSVERLIIDDSGLVDTNIGNLDTSVPDTQVNLNPLNLGGTLCLNPLDQSYSWQWGLETITSRHFCGDCAAFLARIWTVYQPQQTVTPTWPLGYFMSNDMLYLSPAEYDDYVSKCRNNQPPTVFPPTTPPIIPPNRPGIEVLPYDPPSITQPNNPPNDPPSLTLSGTCCDDIVNALNNIAGLMGRGDSKVIVGDDGDISVTGIPDTKYELSSQFETDYEANLNRHGVTPLVPIPFTTVGDYIKDLFDTLGAIK